MPVLKQLTSVGCCRLLPPLEDPGVFDQVEEFVKRGGGHLDDQPVKVSRFLMSILLKSITDTSWKGIHHNLYVSKRQNHISLMEELIPERVQRISS